MDNAIAATWRESFVSHHEQSIGSTPLKPILLRQRRVQEALIRVSALEAVPAGMPKLER